MRYYIKGRTKFAKLHETERIAAKICNNSEKITVLLKNEWKLAKLCETATQSAKQC